MRCVFECLQFKPEEITNIMKDFDEPGFLAPTGLFLGGTKYMVIQGEPGAVIRGKKVLLFFRENFNNGYLVLSSILTSHYSLFYFFLLI